MLKRKKSSATFRIKRWVLFLFRIDSNKKNICYYFYFVVLISIQFRTENILIGKYKNLQQKNIY